MNERKIELTVGLFSTLALALLVLGIFWGKNISLFSNRPTLKLRFENVRGLEEGDPVVVRGIEKGAVKTVILGPQYVDVTCWLEKDVELHSDFNAFIEPKELMGGKQITLEPGSNDEYAALDRIYEGRVKGDLNVLFIQTEKTLMRLDSLLVQTSEIMTPEKIDKIMANIEDATNQTSQLVEETRKPLRTSIAHLESISRQLHEDSTAARVSLLIAKLDTTARIYRQIGMRIERQEGTLGQLISNKDMYNQFISTTQRLDSLISDIKEHPKKYLNVSVF